jgi:hypothetical protein
MPLSGSCIIEIAGGRHAPEAVSFSFTDEQVDLLRGYLREAERLEKCRAIFLHRLRPFQLQNEPYQFGKIKNVVAQGICLSVRSRTPAR